MRASPTLGQLIKDVPAQWADLTFNHIRTDSRTIQPGDLFLALEGARYQGQDFIKEALQRGATACVTEHAYNDLPHAAIIHYPQLAQHLALCAAQFYRQPSQALVVHAFTGTNGKTSSAYLAAQLLNDCYYLGTVGYGFLEHLQPASLTTPQPCDLQRLLAEAHAAKAQSVTMEVSSHALSQRRCAETHFTTASFTNLSRDHLDYHGTFEAYGRAKLKLFEDYALSTALINGEDPFSLTILQALAHQRPDITRLIYGRAALLQALPSTWVDGRLLAEDIVYQPSLQAKLSSPWGQADLNCNLLGPFNLLNTLAALGCASVETQDFAARVAACQSLKPPPGRMEYLVRDNAPAVVIDFAHSPDALQQVLDALRPGLRGKLWTLFGCGGERDRGKRASMAQIAERLSDQVIVTLDNPRHEPPAEIVQDIVLGFSRKQYQVILDRSQAIDYAIQHAQVEDIILIAGKGPEAYQWVGDVKQPYSDKQTALMALNRLKGTHACML